MKKLLIAAAAATLAAGAASAADLPRRVAPPPVFEAVPIFTWTGIYAGLHYSYGFTDNPNIRTVGNQFATEQNVIRGFRPRSLRSEVDGFGHIGGGAGFNYQLTPGAGIVIGGAVDITWTDLSKNIGFLGAPNDVNGTVLPASPNRSIYTQNLDYLGTVNGKIGYAFDRFLVYGTGGLAFGQVEYGASFFGTQNQGAGFPLQFQGTFQKRFEVGYNYGGGIEYAIPADSFLNYIAIGRLLGIKSAVTLKAEYIRYDLGSRNEVIANVNPALAATSSYTSRFATEGNLIRAGLNYKFGGN